MSGICAVVLLLVLSLSLQASADCDCQQGSYCDAVIGGCFPCDPRQCEDYIRDGRNECLPCGYATEKRFLVEDDGLVIEPEIGASKAQGENGEVNMMFIGGLSAIGFLCVIVIILSAIVIYKCKNKGPRSEEKAANDDAQVEKALIHDKRPSYGRQQSCSTCNSDSSAGSADSEDAKHLASLEDSSSGKAATVHITNYLNANAQASMGNHGNHSAPADLAIKSEGRLSDIKE